MVWGPDDWTSPPSEQAKGDGGPGVLTRTERQTNKSPRHRSDTRDALRDARLYRTGCTCMIQWGPYNWTSPPSLRARKYRIWRSSGPHPSEKYNADVENNTKKINDNGREPSGSASFVTSNRDHTNQSTVHRCTGPLVTDRAAVAQPERVSGGRPYADLAWMSAKTGEVPRLIAR